MVFGYLALKIICNSNSKIFFSKKKLNFAQDTYLDIRKAKKILKFKADTLDNNLTKMLQDAR